MTHLLSRYMKNCPCKNLGGMGSGVGEKVARWDGGSSSLGTRAGPQGWGQGILCNKYLGLVPSFWPEMECNNQRLAISSHLCNGTSINTPKPHRLSEHRKCGRAHLEKGMGAR